MAAIGLVIMRWRRLALHLAVLADPGRNLVADEAQVGRNPGAGPLQPPVIEGTVDPAGPDELTTHGRLVAGGRAVRLIRAARLEPGAAFQAVQGRRPEVFRDFAVRGVVRRSRPPAGSRLTCKLQAVHGEPFAPLTRLASSQHESVPPIRNPCVKARWAPGWPPATSSIACGRRRPDWPAGGPTSAERSELASTAAVFPPSRCSCRSSRWSGRAAARPRTGSP